MLPLKTKSGILVQNLLSHLEKFKGYQYFPFKLEKRGQKSRGHAVDNTWAVPKEIRNEKKKEKTKQQK